MATITLRGDGVRRVMRSAARVGFDPYNSWDVQAACAARALRDAARRARAADAAITRADRVRFVAQLRHAFRFPDECDERAPLTSEGARVRDCLDAGVDPYGEL